MVTYAPIRPEESSPLLVWMAWRRYLTAVRASDPDMYEIVEESAWRRLCAELDSARETTAEPWLVTTA